MIRDLINSAPLFAGLSEQEIALLSDSFTAERRASNSPIFKAGEQSDALYVTGKGFVGITAENGHYLATLAPGSLLSEITMLSGKPQEVTANTASELEFWKLTDRKLREVILKKPSIGIKLSQQLGTIVTQMEDYLIERLARISEFSGLPRHTLQAVAHHLQPRSIRANGTLHRAGEMPSALFVVEQGAFELRPEPAGSGQDIQRVAAGAIIGALSLLTNKAYSMNAVATEDSLVWTLSAEDFQNVNSRNPGLRRSLGRSVQSRLSKPDQAQAVLRLSQMPLFAEAPPQSLQALAQRMVLQHIPAGERVYRIGEAGDALYLIENGEIELTEENASGVVEEKARVSAGGFFGEMSLLTGLIRTEDATATRNTNLWILYKADLDDLSAQHPAIGKALSQGLATRLTKTEVVEDHEDERFRSFALLADLGPSDLRQVTKRLRPMRYRTGEIIYQANTPADALFLLERGQAYAQAVNGAGWIIAPGETFGERALLSDEPHTTTVIAETDLDVWMLDKADFDLLMTRYPAIAVNISRVLSRRLAQLPASVAPQGANALVPQSPQQRMQVIQRRAVPQMAPSQQQTSNGLGEWFANLSTPGKIQVVILALLLLWLIGLVAPWLIINLMSGASIASGAALAESSRGLAAVASRGSYDVAAQNSRLAEAVVLADKMAPPTFTPTPPATNTPQAETNVQQTFIIANAAQPTPVPLVQLGGADASLALQANAASAAPVAPDTAQAPPAEEVVQAAAAAPRAWDPRLNQLGVRLDEAPAAPGQAYWRLVDARWADEAESGGKHHIYVEVLDENGNRIVGQPVTVSWDGGGAETGTTENKNPPDYAYNFQMYASGYAYSVQIGGLPSDILRGAGLGSIEARTYGIHTSYYLTFQKMTK